MQNIHLDEKYGDLFGNGNCGNRCPNNHRTTALGNAHMMPHHQQRQQHFNHSPHSPHSPQQRLNNTCGSGNRQGQSSNQNYFQMSQSFALPTQNSYVPHTHQQDSDFQQSSMSIGRNTRTRKVEVPNRKDPFHGSRDFQHPNHDSGLRKQMRDQNINDYQMDRSRIQGEINPNADQMFNSHNEQRRQNKYANYAASQHLEPMYYDQTNFSGLEPDRMFLAEAKKVSDQYTEVGGVGSFDTGYVDPNYMPNIPNMARKMENETKQKRSFRNPQDEFDSNSKLYEFQFTPMTTPQ